MFRQNARMAQTDGTSDDAAMVLGITIALYELICDLQ